MRIDCQKAKELLSLGQVVAVPTETVYGLAASLGSEKGIEKIFELKSRPPANPLIVHVSRKEHVEDLALELPPYFDELTRKFWPGALTLVAPAKPSIPEIARAGLPTIAMRMPNHPDAIEIIDHVGPIVAPSANLSGRPSSTTADHVEEDFGKDFPVLDGGLCRMGIESTILIFKEGKWHAGRLGSIPLEDLEAVLPYPLEPLGSGKNPSCPGQLYKHYSPNAALTMGIDSYGSFPEVILGFKGRSYGSAKKVFILGDLERPETIMANLYKVLRQVDIDGIKEAYVDDDFPKKGILATVAERLAKASSQA
jgi:L-threonylcarbamoyladenylate synthase